MNKRTTKEIWDNIAKNPGKITSGTKEWADSNVNVFSGCSNDCIYCYAKKMAIRFNRKTAENWDKMELNEKAFFKGYSKRRGRIMFPTSHDITPESLGACFIVLRKLIEAKNEILITTKPNIMCIHRIITSFGAFKDKIQFRFTITSYNDDTLGFYEPGAPEFVERIGALILAFNAHWRTSVAIEPFLDLDPVPLILKVAPWCTESIWLGKLNYMKTDFNTWSNIKNIISVIRKLSPDVKNKIRFKDSIRILFRKKTGKKLILT